MPYYKIECPSCKEVDIVFLHVAELESFIRCSSCGEESKPNVIIDECPNMNLAFPGSATHQARREKADATPDYEFVPYNGTDTVPEGREIPGTEKKESL